MEAVRARARAHIVFGAVQLREHKVGEDGHDERLAADVRPPVDLAPEVNL